MNDKLTGGRDTIYKKDNCVFRPAEKWTIEIHKFLIYLHDQGFHYVPYPYGIDEQGMEKVSFIEGDVHNHILPENVKSDETLIAVAQMMKTFHDLGQQYIKELKGDETWMLKPQEPVETICHGDFAPYNIVMNKSQPIGIIDFDTMHPGPRLWDIAYALYRWIPFMSEENVENSGTETRKLERLELFKTTYGIQTNNSVIFSCIIKRLESLIGFMKQAAEDGQTSFQQNIEDGHLNTYYRDLKYLKELQQSSTASND